MLSSTNYPTLLRTLRVGRSVPVMIRPASEVYTRKNEPKGHIRSAVNSDCLCRTCQERTPRLARRSPSTSPTLFAQIAKSNPPQDALQAWPETGVQPPTHPHVCGGTRGVEPTNHVRMGIRGNMQGEKAGDEIFRHGPAVVHEQAVLQPGESLASVPAVPAVPAVVYPRGASINRRSLSGPRGGADMWSTPSDWPWAAYRADIPTLGTDMREGVRLSVGLSHRGGNGCGPRA